MYYPYHPALHPSMGLTLAPVFKDPIGRFSSCAEHETKVQILVLIMLAKSQ